MPDNTREDLAKYRLEMSNEHMKSAKALLDIGSYKDSIGRSYFAMFSAVRALLALEAVDFSKHSGVISYFQKEYIKTSKMDVKYSKSLSQAFQIRNNADYQDFFVVSKKDAEEQFERAEEFVDAVKLLFET